MKLEFVPIQKTRRVPFGAPGDRLRLVLANKPGQAFYEVDVVNVGLCSHTCGDCPEHQLMTGYKIVAGVREPAIQTFCSTRAIDNWWWEKI